MSARSITVEHGGVEYGGQIGTIKSTHLGGEDHGILSAMLHVEWSGGGVGAGGYCLDEPTNRDARDYTRRGTAYGLDHIMQIMATVGVTGWEKLVGKQVIVLFEGRSAWGAQCVGIASTTDEDKVLIFKEHAAKWRELEGVAS